MTTSQTPACVRCGAPVDADDDLPTGPDAAENGCAVGGPEPERPAGARPLLCAVCAWQQAGRAVCSG